MPAFPPKTAACYIRVSTDGQLEYSPQSQLKKIREYAAAHNMLLPNDLIFQEEEGRSARTTAHRTEFQRMIALARQKPRPFDVLLLWKFSRFARSREDAVVYKSMLRRQCGIEVISVSEPLSEDKTAVIMEAVIEAMDEYYSLNLAEEVRRGMNEKASRGGVCHIAPIGYKVENGQYTVDQTFAPVVQSIFAQFLAGVPYRQIAAQLNQQGIRTQNGKPFEVRAVQRILQNPMYIGKVRYLENGVIAGDYQNPHIQLVQGTHPALVADEDFAKAQARIQQIQQSHRRYERANSPQSGMLQGLMRCSNCGCTMVKSKNGLQCYAYSHGVCRQSHYITESVANARVLQAIQSDMQNFNLHILVRTSEQDTQQEALRQQLLRVQNRLERIKRAYEEGIDTLAEYKQNKAAVLQEMERLQQKMLPPKPATQQECQKLFLQKKRDAIAALPDPSLSASEKNALLRTFVDHIVFNRAKNTLDIFYYL